MQIQRLICIFLLSRIEFFFHFQVIKLRRIQKRQFVTSYVGRHSGDLQFDYANEQMRPDLHTVGAT